MKSIAKISALVLALCVASSAYAQDAENYYDETAPQEEAQAPPSSEISAVYPFLRRIFLVEQPLHADITVRFFLAAAARRV